MNADIADVVRRIQSIPQPLTAGDAVPVLQLALEAEAQAIQAADAAAGILSSIPGGQGRVKRMGEIRGELDRATAQAASYGPPAPYQRATLIRLATIALGDLDAVMEATGALAGFRRAAWLDAIGTLVNPQRLVGAIGDLPRNVVDLRNAPQLLSDTPAGDALRWLDDALGALKWPLAGAAVIVVGLVFLRVVAR